MTGPTRWRSQEGGAPDEVRELLAAGARPRGMSRAERTQAARQAARIAAVPAGAVAWWGASKALAAGLALVGLATGAVVVVGHARSRPAAPATTVVRRRAPLPSASPAPPLPAPPPPEPAPAPPAAPRVLAPRVSIAVRPPRAVPPAPQDAPGARPAASSAAPPATPPATLNAASSVPSAPPAAAPSRDESLAAEAALLVRAHRGLQSDPAGSLALVETHTGFAHPALAEERELIAVLALQRVGRREEARARGEALLARWPSGAAARRVRSLLRETP